MINEQEGTKISKFLSLVLRHKPETIGLVLDSQGWTDVDILIQRINGNGVSLNMETLKHIVETNPKKRFAFNESFTKIRANQGHSVEIELGYHAQKPPLVVYHGTAQKNVEKILELGLLKGDRHHVHLSVDIQTAISVGQRHGKPVVFEVQAEKMYGDGFEFFLSNNGVWLTDHVPAKFLTLSKVIKE